MTLDSNVTTSMLKQIVKDRRGVSVIEFAIGLPVFLTAILGGLEVANMAIMQQRVTEIASEIAQNSARGNDQIDEADVSQIMTGARLSAEGSPILTQGRAVLSSVRLNAAKNGQWIEWQRCEGDNKTIKSTYGIQGKGKTDATLVQVGAAPGLKAVDGVNIMVVEVTTTYQPLIGNAFSLFASGKTLKAIAAHVVRDRTTFAIKNDGDLTTAQIKAC